MLRDGWEGGAFTEAPWLLAPAAALVVTMFALHLVTTASPADRAKAVTF